MVDESIDPRTDVDTAWIYDEPDPADVVAGLRRSVQASRTATRVPPGFAPVVGSDDDADHERAA